MFTVYCLARPWINRLAKCLPYLSRAWGRRPSKYYGRFFFPSSILRSASFAFISYQGYSLHPQGFMKFAANESALRRKPFTTFLTTPQLATQLSIFNL